jgi:hypothetical protein
MTALRCGTAGALRAAATCTQQRRCISAAAAPPPPPPSAHSRGSPCRAAPRAQQRLPCRSVLGRGRMSQLASPPAPAATGVAAAAAAAGGAAAADDEGPIVQYVVLRKDLRDGLGWPMVRAAPLAH